MYPMLTIHGECEHCHNHEQLNLDDTGNYLCVECHEELNPDDQEEEEY